MKLEIVGFRPRIVSGKKAAEKENLQRVAGGDVGIYDRVRYKDRKAAEVSTHEEQMAILKKRGPQLDVEVVADARRQLVELQNPNRS